MVALRISEFVSVSNNVLPNKITCVNEESPVSGNLQSIFLKVLRRDCLLTLNMGQWRRKWDVDSTSKPQLQSGFKQFWKLCLNLCSRKWLSPSRRRVISLIPLLLSQLKKLFGEGLNKFKYIAFENTKTFCVPKSWV